MIEVKYGDILYWYGFEFDALNKKDKFLIVLGAKPKKNIVAVLVTSQEKRDRQRSSFHKIAVKDFFPKESWAEISHAWELERGEVKKRINEGKVEKRGTLPPQVTDEIRNKLRESWDIPENLKELLE